MHEGSQETLGESRARVETGIGHTKKPRAHIVELCLFPLKFKIFVTYSNHIPLIVTAKKKKKKEKEKEKINGKN